jgi:hypothetical protein
MNQSMQISGEESVREREKWLADVRAHIAMASVSNSALMQQSGKGRVSRSQIFLLTEMSLSGMAAICEDDFYEFLNRKTESLSSQLLRIDDDQPNWGAARKIINIYLRLCAMNKDLHPGFGMSNVEPMLEVPLDNHTVSKISEIAGIEFTPKFQIKNLGPTLNSIIQFEAKKIADKHGLFRYELDVLYWNNKKIAQQI